tara:strand:- start:7344 stop:7589 length:246 start_codon:yes stop_codon:yes gene_type:complete
MEIRRGQTSSVKYDLDEQTMKVLSSNTMTFKEAKRMMRDIENVLKKAQPPSNTAPDDNLSLIKPPWLLRKVLGWQNIIKRA